MTKATVAAIVLFAGAASALLAAPGILTLKKDKTEHFGDIIEAPTSYKITIQGKLLEIPKADVQAVQYGTLEGLYKLRKDKLDAKDVQGHYRLALWAKDYKLDKAMVEQLEATLAIDPRHANAKLLLEAYRKGVLDKPKPEGSGETVPTTQSIGPISVSKYPLLSKADINVIRVVEMDPRENLAVKPAPGAADKVWSDIEGKKIGGMDFTGDRAKDAFYRMSPNQQLKIAMDGVPEDDLYKLATLFTVNNDPMPLLTWKSKIHPWVINNCANSACHGNTNPGKVPYQLVNVTSPDDRVTYTNFFLTNQYKGKDGSLIDTDKPEDSLLLQYALPPENMGVKAHPKVGDVAITPAIKGKNDPMYRLLWTWIGNRSQGGLRSPLRPSYHITWPPTGADSTTKPPEIKPPENPAVVKPPVVKPREKPRSSSGLPRTN